MRTHRSDCPVTSRITCPGVSLVCLPAVWPLIGLCGYTAALIAHAALCKKKILTPYARNDGYALLYIRSAKVAYKSSQQTHNVPSTSLQRRCNVMTLQRRCKDVVATLCACWVICHLLSLINVLTKPLLWNVSTNRRH